MYRILVAGAGYTGSRIAFYFKEKKQKVWALTRTGRRNAEFEAAGIEPITADLTLPETLKGLPAVNFAVICPAPDEGSEENYQKIYLDGVRNLLDALREKSRHSFIVYLSSTAVWRPRSGEWVDETTPPDPETEKGRILVQAEKNILGSGYPSAVFRLAGIYGPGRNRLKALDTGKIPQEENAYMNMIHVDDIAAAIPVLFKKAEAGHVYTGVDERPVLRSEFYKEIAEIAGKNAAFDFKGAGGGKRCSNKKLKSLGFEFRYPSFVQGYESFLKKS